MTEERYLAGETSLVERLGGSPSGVDDLLGAVSRTAALAIDRKRLVERLLAMHRSLGGGALSLDNIHALEDPNVFIVATGQQPGLLTGPLYTVLKAATAIAIARRLERMSKFRFVPLFWIASDDHDLAEIEGCSAVDEHGDVRRFRVPLSPPDTSSASLRVPAGAAVIVDELFAAIPTGVHEAAIRSLAAPIEGERWPVWFARCLSRLFAKSGLVLFEPHVAPDLLAPILSREAEQPARMGRALAEGARVLSTLGLEAPLPTDRPSPLFLARDGRRRRFDPRHDSADAPFTADAALRAIAQSAVLPAPVVVGGPGELSYWLQLTEAFDLLGIPRPLFVPRVSATLVEPRIRRALEALGLELGEVLVDPARLGARTAEQVSPGWERPNPHAADAIAALDRLGASLQGRQASKRFAELRATFRASLEKLLRLAEDEARDTAGVSRRRTELVSRTLRPHGTMQDRVLNPIPFLVRHGADLFERVAGEIDPLDFDHVLIHLESDSPRPGHD